MKRQGGVVIKNLRKKPTLKTLAQITGLSVTAVSKALKDAPDIKESTKKRVRLVAKEVGYHPDLAAQRLRTGKTNVVAVQMDLDCGMFSMTADFISGVSEALANTPYTMVLAPMGHGEDPLATVRQLAETRAADGLILSSIEPHDQRLAYLTDVGMPFATHGRSNMGIEHAYCDFDCRSFGRDAVGLLAEMGVKRACLLAPPAQYSYVRFMREGFIEGVEQLGLESLCITSDGEKLSITVIVERVRRMLTEERGSIGVVCASPSIAVGVINGIEAAGLEVGKDVQIVAKQSPNNPLRWFGRKICSIEEDHKAAGHALGLSLLKIIDGAPVEEHQHVVYPADTGSCVLCDNLPCECASRSISSFTP